MTETPVDKPVRIFIIASASIAFFSIMNVFVKLAAETHSIPQISFFRTFLGLLPIIALILWRHDLNLLKTDRLSGHFMRSFVGFFSMMCFFWSFALLPLASATAIHFAAPLVLTGLSVLLLDERVGPHRWTAVIVGLVAVLFMLQPAGNGNLEGSLIAMCAAILSAFAMICVRKLGQTEHALTIAFYFSAFASVFSLALAVFVWTPLTLVSGLYLFAIGILGGCGQILLTYAYAKAPAAFVSPFSYLGIVFATGFDLVIWQHWPDWHIMVGSVVVVASGLYIVWREARKQYTPTIETEIYDLGIANPDSKKDRPNG